MSLRLTGGGAIGEAASAARAFGIAQGLGRADLARLCIVVEEVIANLYDHGGVTASDEVRLELAYDSSCFRISIVDPGAPFNPMSTPPSAGSAGGGGAGLGLIRAWASLISYRPSSEGNHLELLLPIGKQGGDADA